MTGAGRFVGLRTTALGELVASLRVPHRHTRLDAATGAVELACLADWRSGAVGSGVMGLARSAGRTWRRQRRILDSLASVGAVSQVGRRVTVNLAVYVHQRDRNDGPYVQLLPDAIAAQAAHHGLDRSATDIYTYLVRAADSDTHTITDTSQQALAATCNTGWPAMHAALQELDRAGLVAATFCRGHRVTVTVTGRPAVILPAPIRADRRRERRLAALPGGPADKTATRLWQHFGLPGLPAAALVGELREAARQGAPLGGVVEHVAAGGSLATATDPVPVLVWRVRQAVASYQQARVARQATETRRQAEMTVQAVSDAQEAVEAAVVAADSRWVRHVLGASATSEIAGRLAGQGVGGLQRLPKPVVASLVLDWARRCVAARPDLDPVDALHAGLVHSPPRAGPGPPIGRDATGPTITETLT